MRDMFSMLIKIFIIQCYSAGILKFLRWTVFGYLSEWSVNIRNTRPLTMLLNSEYRTCKYCRCVKLLKLKCNLYFATCTLYVYEHELCDWCLIFDMSKGRVQQCHTFLTLCLQGKVVLFNTFINASCQKILMTRLHLINGIWKRKKVIVSLPVSGS